MRMRKLSALLLLVLATSGCGPKPAAGPALTWDGMQLRGARFYERVMERVTLHYTLPTDPETVERHGNQVSGLLGSGVALGKIPPGVRLEIWVLPTGSPWPAGAPSPFPGSPTRATGPGVMLMREETVSAAPVPRAILAASPWNGLMVAATQPEGSPLFASAWLHEGMGQIMNQAVSDFPTRQWGRDYLGLTRSDIRPWDAKDLLATAERVEALVSGAAVKPAGQSGGVPLVTAATALAALFVDRWGIDWPQTHPLPVDAASPEAALKWVTEAAATEEALERFQSRMKAAIKQQVQNGNDLSQPVALAEMRPERIAPVRVKAVNPPAQGGTGLAYHVAARFDEPGRTLSGVAEIRWENRSGVGLDRLYLDLRNNGYRPVRFGGRTLIRSVAANGSPVSFTAQGVDLEVRLGRQLEPGETTTLLVAFESRLPAAVTVMMGGGRPVEQPAPSGSYGFTDLFPTLATLEEGGWRHLPAMGFWTVELDVPPALELKGPSAPQGRRTVGDRTLWRFAPAGVRVWSASAVIAAR